MSVSPLERRFAPNQNRHISGCLGCLVCPKQVKIEMETGARTELRTIAEGVAPVHVDGDYGRQSECGLDAIHGVCKKEDGIQELAAFIADGGVDGVQLAAHLES